MEALALNRDLRAVHAFTGHFVLDRRGAADREALVVAVRTHRIGVARDQHAHKAVRLGRLHGFLHHGLRFRRQIVLIEVEEDDEGLRRRRWGWRRSRRWRWSRRRRWRRRRRCRIQVIANAEHHSLFVQIAYLFSEMRCPRQNAHVRNVEAIHRNRAVTPVEREVEVVGQRVVETRHSLPHEAVVDPGGQVPAADERVVKL